MAVVGQVTHVDCKVMVCTDVYALDTAVETKHTTHNRDTNKES